MEGAQSIYSIRNRNFAIRNELLFLNDNYLLNFIALTDLVNHIKSFINLPKAGMLPVEMLCIGAAVTDEKLRATGVSSGMRH